MIANWLTLPPERIVLVEPFFFSLRNPGMLREQLDGLGLPPSDEEWQHPDASWQDRFFRLFSPRLAGRHWAFKEVLSAEHRRVISTFAPRRIVVTVRNIRDIAASFLEKHKIQKNTDRLDHDWVSSYCLRESHEIVDFCTTLKDRGIPWRVSRYEDFVASAEMRNALAEFVGWPGGGDVARHLDRLRRSFEIERHGRMVSSQRRHWNERDLDSRERVLAEEIVSQCSRYQDFFGYCSSEAAP